MQWKHKVLAKKVVIWLTASIFMVEPMAMAVAPIVADKNAPITRQALIQETSNGIPLVNITAPNAAGVSRNDYTHFNVPEKGAILNNSYTLQNTQLAGYVQGNQNMMRGSAKIIVNEVTSSNPSSIRGFMEVAGSRASVVVANPNGISVNGGGFINTSQAILTTGKPQFDAQGNLKDYRVNTSTIVINGAGLDGKQTDKLAILTTATEINAGIWANDLNVQLGHNTVDANTLQSTPIGQAEKQGVILDVAAIGGMYANVITLKGTDKGLGVNMQGVMSSTKASYIDVNGNLHVTGTVYSQGDQSIKTQSITNEKLIGGYGNIDIQTGNLDNKKGTIVSDKSFTITAESINNINGKIVSSKATNITTKDAIQNKEGYITSTGDITINTKDIQLDGTIAGGHDVNITTKSDISNATISDKSGITQAGHDLSITTTGTVENVKSLTADNTINIKAQAVEQNKDGVIEAKDINVNAPHIANYGTITADNTTAITSEHLENIETGAIYGDNIQIKANNVENYKNRALEKKLQDEVAVLRQKEKELDDAFAVDITTFTTKEQETEYKANIKTKTEAYEAQLAKVKQAQAAIDALTGASIAGRENVTIQADTISNRNHSSIYSGNAMDLQATSSITNDGASIESMGNMKVEAPVVNNENTTFSAERVIIDERELPKAIRIEQDGHPEKGQTFPVTEFSSLGSGYGAYHDKGTINQTELYEHVTYVPLQQISEAERKEGETPIPEELVGTMPTQNSYAELFAKFGIQPLPNDRPYNDVVNPSDPTIKSAQDAWDAQFLQKIDELNRAIDRHNQQIESEYPGIKNKKIDLYTIVRRHILKSEKRVKATDAGVIRSGGNMAITGDVRNINSQMVAGHTLAITGNTENIATTNQVKEDVFGTNQFSYTKRLSFPHKAKVRRYKSEVLITPEIHLSNPTSLGVAEFKDNTSERPDEVDIARKRRQEITDFLDPFNGTGEGSASSNNASDIVPIHLSSLTKLHPESTSKYLIETDSRFTNKKEFLSSDYLIQQLAWNPERVMKKLGDGFYEQGLVRDQIMNQTGQRYLDGYTSDEETFKALMDSGVAYAREHKLTPGIALTKEQIAGLTSDIVWLEERTVQVNGNNYTVLFPHVYLRPSQKIHLTTDGSLISGKQLVIDAKNTIHNEGVLYGNTIVMEGGNITNEGRILGDVALIHSTGNFDSTGWIEGKDRVQITADKDLSIRSTVNRYANYDAINQVADIAVTGNEGIMLLGSKGNMTLQGATLEQLGKQGSTILQSGGNIDFTTQTLTSKKDMTLNKDNYLRTYNKIELGTTIQSAGDITLLAKQDVNARALTMSSENGAIAMGAGRDINITNGESQKGYDFGLKYKSRGLLSSTTTTIKTTDRHTGILSSTISGASMNMQANRDVNLQAAKVVGTNDVLLHADRNITTTSAEQKDRNTTDIKVKTSGIMGAGLGIMIGTQSTRDQFTGDYTTQVGTSIGSLQGKTDISAGDTIHMTTTNVVGKEGVSIQAQDILLDGKNNRSKEEYIHTEKSSGLTVSLGGTVANAVNTAVQYKNQAKDRDDKRLAALEMYEAGSTLKDALQDVQGYRNFAGTTLSGLKESAQNKVKSGQDLVSKSSYVNEEGKFVVTNEKMYNEGRTMTEAGNQQLDALNKTTEQDLQKAKDAKQDKLFNIHVGIGSRSSKEVYTNESVTYAGGTISSDGTIQITANSSNKNKGNLQAIGTTIAGNTVSIDASKSAILQSGENITYNTSNTQSSGWSIGASISPTNGSILGLDATAYAAKGKENTERTTHTGTIVIGRDSVVIDTGNDLNVEGSKIIGKRVEANVDRNLTITSLQDQKNYTSRTKSSNISVSTDIGKVPLGMLSQNKGNIDSQYKSVTDQAGVFAGTDGYHIQVDKDTTLTGAVITSKASKDNNELHTKTLTMKDITNEASYSVGSKGVSFSTDKINKCNPLGYDRTLGIPVSGSASNVTKSAVADGIIEVADKLSTKEINHNVEDAFKQLTPIFDKKKVEERQALVNTLSEKGFQMVGDLAVAKRAELLKKASAAKEAGNQAKADEYLKESHKWDDGGIYKIGLHAAVGGVLSNLASGNTLSGVKGASINELVQRELSKIDNVDLHKYANFVLGKIVGDDAATEAIMDKANKYNWLNHYDQMALLADIDRYTAGKINKFEMANKLGFYIALNNSTYPYAGELGINDGIDDTISGNGISSLVGYFWGSETLAAGIYSYAKQEGIYRAILDADVAYHSSYMTYSWLKTHYPNLNHNFSDRIKADENNFTINVLNGLKSKNAPNIGDVYADQGDPVYSAPWGNYVRHDGVDYYTTREANATMITSIKPTPVEKIDDRVKDESTVRGVAVSISKNAITAPAEHAVLVTGLEELKAVTSFGKSLNYGLSSMVIGLENYPYYDGMSYVKVVGANVVTDLTVTGGTTYAVTKVVPDEYKPYSIIFTPIFVEIGGQVFMLQNKVNNFMEKYGGVKKNKESQEGENK